MYPFFRGQYLVTQNTLNKKGLIRKAPPQVGAADGQECEKMNSQLKRGTLELCVLSIVSGSDCYGYELVNRISECMQVTEGTIYPLMKRLKDSGTIDSYIVESQEGPPRKYYKITESGKEELRRLTDEWFEFTESVNRLLKGDNGKDGCTE